jgi:S1-C subfamily serine protease
MKKIIIFFVLLFSLGIGSVSANSNLKIYLYDELVDMDNPVIVNGNTLVPLRVLFESLGATVAWDEQTKTVAAKKGDTNLFIQIGNKNVTKNGSTFIIEEPAAIINDKTYVPLRFVAESFNQDVNWDKENNAVHIGKSLSAKDISKQAAAAVVLVKTYDISNSPYATGSGFIIDSNGIIVTNYHVIDRASSASVKLIDGTNLEITKIINYDVSKDIAILKVNTNKSLPVVNLGDSDKVENGEKVFTIGSPKGNENTITEGIVSNKNHFFLNQSQIQITAQIDHGSSGGALFNTRGEVIGITDGGITDSSANLYFAIPINVYKNMYKNDMNLSLDQVYNNEHVVHFTDATYVGDKENNIPNGIGVMVFTSGDQYIGSFVNGKFEGKGKYTWIAGGNYDGDWVNGLKQGYGKDTDAIGNVYEGQFSNNSGNGKGKITFLNGDILYCDFLNGLANGYGTYYYANGTTISGTWINGTYLK